MLSGARIAARGKTTAMRSGAYVLAICQTGGGRVIVVDKKGRARHVADKTIDGMTLGRLAVTFSQIQTPNQGDIAIGRVLAEINPHRVAVAHHKITPQTEAKLRKHVGNAVWLIVAGLRKALDEA